MQTATVRPLRIILLLLVLLSCQREVHFPEIPPENLQNELQRNQDGQCQPIQVTGTFYQHVPLSDTNYLEVNVVVRKTEAYHITTETINGYGFEASGVFRDTGVTRIKLLGKGNPMEPQQDTFVITLGETSCTAAVRVTVPEVHPATFTLLGSPQTCLNAAVNGVYVKGNNLGSVSFVSLQADVTATGPYQLSTDTVNGYYFSGSGNITATGVQTLLLYAHGTPQAVSTDAFHLSNHLSTCTFSVGVSAGYEPASGLDYFPLTTGNTWTYLDVRSSVNGNTYTIKRTIADTTTLNGVGYTIMNEENRAQGNAKRLFRQEGSDYFEQARVDGFNAAVTYSEPIEDDVLFLKQYVGRGTYWESQEFKGPIMGGQLIILKYVFSCLGSNEAITIGNKSYADVLKIRIEPLVRPTDQDFSSAGEFTDCYYARGIGLIYTINYVNGFVRKHWILQDYTVH